MNKENIGNSKDTRKSKMNIIGRELTGKNETFMGKDRTVEEEVRRIAYQGFTLCTKGRIVRG